ncbi:hypothetical protein ABZV29_36385 [Streptomyces sp. NPDC005236]
MGAALAEPTAVERSRHVKRAAQAAGVGLGAAVGSALATRLLLDSNACRNMPDYGCLGFVVMWSYLLPVLTFPFTWAGLRILRVRPAWLTALLGTGIGWYLIRNLKALQ